MDSKEMNTKEAIKFVSKHIADFRERTEDAFDKEGCKKLIMEAKGVIALLQQGEALKAENVELKAYKQIVKVVEDEFGEYALTIHTPTKHFPLRYASKYEDRRNTIKVFIEEIKQKYLKEANPNEAGKAKDNRK